MSARRRRAREKDEGIGAAFALLERAHRRHARRLTAAWFVGSLLATLLTLAVVGAVFAAAWEAWKRWP